VTEVTGGAFVSAIAIVVENRPSRNQSQTPERGGQPGSLTTWQFCASYEMRKETKLLHCKVSPVASICMLLPLVGVVIACTLFACIGAALLTLLPKFRLTFGNVVLFVIGAVPSSAVSAVVYGRVFGNETGELNTTAVLFLFVVLLVAGLFGGFVTVSVYKWLIRFRHLQRPSRNPVGR
jgi:hypothetical protein